MPRTKKEPETEPDTKINDKWPVVGWVKPSKSGKSLLVFNGDGENSVLMGVLNKKQVMRLFNGDIEAAPIKEIPEN